MPGLLLILTSCSSVNADQPRSGTEAALDCALPNGPVAVAASSRSNAPAPEVTPKVEAVLNHAVNAGEEFSVLDTDESPTILEQGKLEVNANNSLAQEQQKQRLRAQAKTIIESARADAPEADPLAALETAARTIHARAPRGTVVLIDSGLQTSGALHYQSDHLLLASGGDLAAHLRSTGELPDLNGITVLLSGIGDTAAPQQRLDNASRNRFVEQWSAIAKAAGARCVDVDTQPLTKPARRGLPAVTTVPVPRPPKLRLQVDQPVALREDSVGFEDNSDKFRDMQRARTVLREIATQILAGHHRVTLVGTTATAGTEAGRHSLSLRRAQAVKRLLVELGVPSTRMAAKGVGIHYPEHVNDLDKRGNLIPELAVRNRAVFVILK